MAVSASNFLEFFGIGGDLSVSGVTVTLDNAMGVPAVFAAVNFLSGTIAGLPLKHYKKTEQGREEQKGELSAILSRAVNDETSSFEWRKYSFERTLTSGRQVTYIQRVGDRVVNLYPLDPAHVTVKKASGLKTYRYAPPGVRAKIYKAAEIIDIPFCLKSDMVKAISPIMTNKDTIGLAIAATNYGSKFFLNGGVPPFVMTGNFTSGKGLNRASEDLHDAIKKASKESRLALTLPSGHDIKTLGIDPEKSQLVQLKKFIIEEVARIYSLPPTFLQDLTRATFSNVEQQDLHLVKHTIKRWVEQAEQELNLKLFGRKNTDEYVEFNLDGLLRGDFKTRMEGYAQGIQNGVLKPNEARRQENRPDDPEGDHLMIQGATVPLGSQPKTQQPVEPAKGEDNAT
ncbi:MAG: phage portal protein [Pseudohongiellaceae bacterium]|nr:phage portal protein [Pseudohongiellaceae bacterium]